MLEVCKKKLHIILKRFDDACRLLAFHWTKRDVQNFKFGGTDVITTKACHTPTKATKDNGHYEVLFMRRCTTSGNVATSRLLYAYSSTQETLHEIVTVLFRLSSFVWDCRSSQSHSSVRAFLVPQGNRSVSLTPIFFMGLSISSRAEEGPSMALVEQELCSISVSSKCHATSV